MRALAALALAAVAAGCASTAKRVATPYAVTLVASPQVNPDARGRPSPIQVTVYELAAAGAFEAADFFSLQADARAALGDDVLAVDQFILRPGERHVLRRPGNVEGQVLAVVAAYRDLERSGWRLHVPLPDARQTNIYKFWQFSPGEKSIAIDVGRDRLDVLDAAS